MSKKQSNSRKLLSGASLLAATAAIVGATPAAYAQNNTQGSSDEEIVVTGSRIPQPNLNSPSPVQVLTDQEIKLTGTSDTIDLLNQLPQVIQLTAVDFSNTSNPLSTPGGLTTIDLRGLGPQRTLVLVNGRRLGVGDPNTGNPNPSPDIDQIPAALIQRVEVVTGGASATYGSDAIAGVVNFIMRQDFEGFRIDYQRGWDTHTNDDASQRATLAGSAPFQGPSTLAPTDVSDGEVDSFSVSLGVNSADHNGNVTAYMNYRHANPVMMRDRDFSACAFRLKPQRCNGSANSNRFAASGTYWAVSGTTFVPWGSVTTTPPSLFNSNNFEFLSRGDERYSGGLFAHYQINESANVYGEFSYMNDHSDVEVAPSALFLGANSLTVDGNYPVNCGNPYTDLNERTIMGCSLADSANNVTKSVGIGRRNVEGGPRHSFYEHQNFRFVLGINGDVAPGWTYDVNTSYFYTTLFQRNSGYLSLSRVDRALDVLTGPTFLPDGVTPNPLVGVPECRSVWDSSDVACVPFNIFQDGGVTQAAETYLLTAGTSYGSTSEQIAEANLVGDLGESMGLHSPWANDGIQVALGTQYRRDTYNYLPDAAELVGDLSGFGGLAGQIQNAGFDVFELYGEARVPLVQDAPLARELSAEVGYRYSNYNTAAGTVDTWKAGMQWEPTEDIRFRLMFQHAIRAPNSVELFNPAVLNLTSTPASDPCAGVLTVAQTALCAAAFPASAGFLGGIPDCISGQCGALNGGNVNLTSETADTTSLGFTTTPRFLPGFTASVDWWRIKMANVIGTLNGGTIMAQCLATDSAFWCNQITRSPSNGAIWGQGFVQQTGVNAGLSETSGIDVQAGYHMDIGDWGSLAASLNGSWLAQVAGEGSPGLGWTDCVGQFGTGCGGPIPEWRHTMRLSWETPWNILGSVQWRHIGGVGPDTTPARRSFDIPAFDYFDVSGTWDVNDHVQFRMGVNNIADKDPPLLDSRTSGTGSPNTYPTYDLLGRAWFMGVTANF